MEELFNAEPNSWVVVEAHNVFNLSPDELEPMLDEFTAVEDFKDC